MLAAKAGIAWALPVALTCFAGAQGRQLQPGNTLKITCEQVPSLCVIRTIDGSGIVSLPGVGNVAAIDMDRAKFQTRLEAILSAKYGRRIRIQVDAYTLARDPVRVEGFVQKPLSREFHPGLTVLDMLRDAAIRQDGDDGQVTLVHANGRSVSVDLGQGDAAVQPGDCIEVGPLSGSSMVTVVGPVLKPGSLRCTPGLTLARAIQEAGGLEGHADGSHIALHRMDGTERTVSLRADGEMMLQPGDTLAVGLSKVRLFVSISGPVPHPGLVEFKVGMTLTQAIRAAGGNPEKLGDAVSVVRVRDTHMRKTKYHLVRILAKMDPDPVLESADSIALGGR